MRERCSRLAINDSAAGAREAHEALLRNVQPDLHRYISGLVGRSSADDRLQDAFLLICRNLKWLRDPALFVQELSNRREAAAILDIGNQPPPLG